MDFSLSSLMSDYYLSSLYRQNSNVNYLSSLYGQNNNAFYLGGLYCQSNVLNNAQDSAAGKAEYPSFQSVFAASLKGQSFKELLTTQFPGAKYHVMDTSKISASAWERNDYPFEIFFGDEVDESVLDWKPTSQEPSMLDAKVQSKLNEAKGKYAVIVPPELEEKLESNKTLAQSIMSKISTLMMQQDTVPSTIDSFSIALDEDGNISNYRFSGGRGRMTLSTDKKSQQYNQVKTEWMLQQVRRHHL